jgi:hypothetical protein
MPMSKAEGERAEVVEEIDADVLQEAREAGVDVDEIIDSTIERRSDYGAGTIARLCQSNIEQATNATEGEQVTALVAGSRDRHGSNWPRRVSLVSSDGDHIEATTWDGSIPSEQGGEVAIPHGNAATLRCSYDNEYENWELEGVSSVTSLPQDEFKRRLKQVAVLPDDVSSRQEYEVEVVMGNVVSVDTVTLWEDDEPTEDGPVMMEDERGSQRPHFDVLLSVPGQETVVRARFDRQRYGKPLHFVPDLWQVTQDACIEMESPQAQADFVESALEGTNVAVVGSVANFDTSQNDGERTRWMRMNATAIVEIDQPAERAAAADPDTEKQSFVDDHEDDDTKDDDDESSADTPDDQPESKVGEIVEHRVEELASDIEQYCELVDEDPGSLTVDDVREQLVDDDSVPDGVVAQAIRDAGGEPDAETPDSPDSEGGETTAEADDGEAGSAWDKQERADGTYTCPGEGCLFNGGESTLLGHILDAHDADDPEDWFREQVSND